MTQEPFANHVNPMPPNFALQQIQQAVRQIPASWISVVGTTVPDFTGTSSSSEMNVFLGVVLPDFVPRAFVESCGPSQIYIAVLQV